MTTAAMPTATTTPSSENATMAENADGTNTDGTNTDGASDGANVAFIPTAAVLADLLQSIEDIGVVRADACANVDDDITFIKHTSLLIAQIARSYYIDYRLPASAETGRALSRLVDWALACIGTMRACDSQFTEHDVYNDAKL